MRSLDIKNTYKKDLKQVLKQGWDSDKINEVVTQLLNDENLDPTLKDHQLIGNLKDFRECHVFGDLVIIYQRTDEILSLYKIGRHQDLFKNY
ncbi:MULTISPECIES: type II toxin-antitoxin system YafQ family toxin [Campylobacter]|uniref:type II toxin-antitoxin system RelE/ParE family toxin n=1 Tax=Campylobacter TaxID=194 RepID=UPI0023F222C1|nr:MULTISPECIES: type II toxin-antitoxin system YafQ family toxin [Campylobacter]MCI6641473.1 type II toxin-antitoxin system YafQ family toxin [Campylobacter sp.]MDD7422153.1 type II toxin-antitoxin system YafQ family toxin [Campylobacter hominis]MDY3117814.1 type II toxin-antitoxin system YafQ family toxin [Campylobacter hominis]